MSTMDTRPGIPGHRGHGHGRGVLPCVIAIGLVVLGTTSCACSSRVREMPRSETSPAALSLFVTGVVAEQRGDFEAASRAYDQAFVEGARTPTVAIARARCRLYRGEAQAAYRLLHDSWERSPGDARLLGLLSELSFALAPPDEAIGFSRRLLLADPSRVRPAHHLEELLRREGRTDEVVMIFEEAATSPAVSRYLQRRLEVIKADPHR